MVIMYEKIGSSNKLYHRAKAKINLWHDFSSFIIFQIEMAIGPDHLATYHV